MLYSLYTSYRYVKKHCFSGLFSPVRRVSFLPLLIFVVISCAGSSLGQVTYSANWTLVSNSAVWGSKLHTANTANATATIQDTGTEAFVIYRAGPESGIFQVVVDGKQDAMKEIDGYAPSILWNKKTIIASNLTNGPHTIVITVTGKKNSKSTNTTVSIVDRWIVGRGIWSIEKAWEWYKSKPWLVGWNYVPTTCVNTTEWWQDEKKVNDSIIHRELGLGEKLGYNTIIVYLQYLVWLKDSAYCKNRFSHFLDLAESHHMTVSPVFFDDVNFVCSGTDCGNSHLGDQGEPNPAILMSQWGASPGPTYTLDANQRPYFKRYVQDFARTFGNDKRILMWDLYNEPSNGGVSTKTYPLVELVFQWMREIGTSQPLTVSEWTGGANGWPYNLSDICSFHGYLNNSGLSGRINELRASQRPIICTEWLARGGPGTDIAKDLPLLKRLGIGAIQWSLINGRMHCERAWTSYQSTNNPWFHDVLYNDGKPYKAEEVDAILKNLAHKTLNWVPGTTDGSLVAKSGCTDPRYSQYDSMATVENGSGTTLLPPIVIRGCTDANSKNYNPFATQSDPAMCNAVAVLPDQKEIIKTSQQKLFSFIDKNQIRISGNRTVTVELFSVNGRSVWSEQVNGPGLVNIGSSVKSGIYFVRASCDNTVRFSPVFRVSN